MSLLLLGDLCLNEASPFEDGDVGQSLCDGVQPLLREQTLVIANLECAITRIKEGVPCKWATLAAPPTAVSRLAGLDVAVLANNHVGDFGPGGVDETIATLDAAGVKQVGYGSNLEQALKPLLLETDEGSVAIVALACPTTNSGCLATHDLPGVAPLSSRLLQRAVESASSLASTVLVYLHWGAEQSHDPVPDQMRLARRAIDWGAHVVVGCHAHVIQGYEAYRDGWIFYGLGNYFFPSVETKEVLEDGSVRLGRQVQARPNRQSLAVELAIQSGLKGKRLVPVSIMPLEFGADRAPQPVEKGELTVTLDRLNTRLDRYGALYWRRLEGADEPEFRAIVHNGVVAYFYPDPPISDSDLGFRATLRCRVGDFRVSLKSFLKRLLRAYTKLLER